MTVRGPTSIDSFRVTVSDFLREYTSAQRIAARAIDQRYDRLWQSIERLLSIGGKRIRPYILAASYEAFARQPFPSDLLSVACAQELLHLAMLIHDDIIDRDDMRYGISNVCGQYMDIYHSDIPDQTNRRHFATSTALLAGDILLSQAHLMTSRAALTDGKIAQLQSIIGTSVFEVVGGELLDTEAAFSPPRSDHALRIGRYKTASYTFIGPLKIGAILAGVTNVQLSRIEDIGSALGIGYQLRDDILGVFGEPAITGKSTLGDIREAKRTYLIEQFEKQATAAQRRLFEPLFGNVDITDHDMIAVKRLLRESGALQAAETAIVEQSKQAKRLIGELELTPEWSRPLIELVERCMARTK
ncbi:MAG: polyprenyl synthetase family protein [Candidatus Saccharimonadales bacterium]